VNGSRRTRILAVLAAAGGDDVSAAGLCDVCRSVTGLTGAGIMLMSDDVALGSVGTTDTVSALIEDLQFSLGEGPCVDAYRLDRPVLEPDLADPAVPRWLAFAGPVIDAGARAVFGFPLSVGAVRLGALDFYADRSGPLTDEQQADALVLADIAAETVLGMQADSATGAPGAELRAGSNFQYVVHQAAGMVSAQLDVSVTQALVRLRAFAFGNERMLADVCSDVVARRLRFNADDR
jgi:hypothetical protein